MTRVLIGPADAANIYYRTQWNSDAFCVYIEGEKTVLYVAGFEYLRAKKKVKNTQVKELTDLRKILQEITGEVYVDKDFPYRYTEHITGTVHVKHPYWTARVTKNQQEITYIEETQHLAQKAIQCVEDILKQTELRKGIAYYKGEILTSEYLKLKARTYLIQHEADCPDMIISSGEQTAYPHDGGSGAIREGPVIIDIFPQGKNRYHGDMTRTILLGKSAKVEQMLKAVQQAHKECIQRCVPGTSIASLQQHAEKVLCEYGFETTKEQGFIHALGHGVGLDIHEEPSVSGRNEETLEEGMVITIEPGLYYDVGVRWEDTVVVGKEPRVLGR